MPTLAIKDFISTVKTASSGKYSKTLITFRNIALAKIKDGRQFTLGPDKGGTKVYGQNFIIGKDKKGKETFTLEYSKQKKPKLDKDGNPDTTKENISKFFKDGDFGGGGGSGGGASDTAINESLQCFYCSLLFNNSNISKLTPENCTIQNLQAQYQYCFTYAKKGADRYGTNLKKFNAELYSVAEKKTKSSNWIEDIDVKGQNVYMRIAQKLYDSAVATPFKNKTVYFHRASSWMDAIYEVKDRALKADQKLSTEAQKAPLSGLSDDKWNPGDIWLSTIGDADQNPNASGEGNSPLCYNNESKSDCSTFELLKDQVRINAKEGKLLGVSLKKTAANSAASLSQFNTKDRTQNKVVTYTGFVFGQTGNFFGSADMYLHFGSGDTMQLRSTATTSSWQGEIKGAAAAGGKIGGGGVNYYMEAILKQSIGNDAVQGVKLWSEQKTVDKAKMYELYKTYTKLQKGNFKDVLPTVRFKSDDKNLTKAYAKLKDFRLIGEDEKADDNLSNIKYDKKFKQYVVKEGSITAQEKYVNRKDFDILADNYTAKGKNASPAFYFSKYMGLLFLKALYTAKNNPMKGQKAIDEYSKQIVRYAMSNTDISSYFIKIYWIQFTLSWTFFFQIPHLTLDNTPLLVYNGTHEEW